MERTRGGEGGGGGARGVSVPGWGGRAEGLISEAPRGREGVTPSHWRQCMASKLMGPILSDIKKKITSIQSCF